MQSSSAFASRNLGEAVDGESGMVYGKRGNAVKKSAFVSRNLNITTAQNPARPPAAAGAQRRRWVLSEIA